MNITRLLLGTILLCTAIACRAQVLQLVSLNLPRYPPLFLSAGIEFDLVFEADVGSDGSLNDIRLVSARGLTDVAQRWLDNKGIRETELARITSELGRWRIEPLRNLATDTDKMRKLVEVGFRYRLLGSDIGKCDYPSSCTCRYEIQQTADGVVVSIFAVKATVME